MFYLKLYRNNNEEKPFTFKTMKIQTKNVLGALFQYNGLHRLVWVAGTTGLILNYNLSFQAWAFGSEGFS